MARFAPVAGLLVLVALAGCGGGTLRGVPVEPTPASGSPPASPSLRTDPAATVILVNLGGGLGPLGQTEIMVPTLTVYGDGRAYAPAPDQPLTGVVAVTQGRVPAAAVETAVRDLSAAGLLSGKPDFGDTGVLDAPSLEVTIGLADREVQLLVSAPGLAENRLSRGERQRRGDLMQVIDRLRAAVVDSEPYQPDRYRVQVRSARVPAAEVRPEPWPRDALGAPEAFGAPATRYSGRCQVLRADAAGVDRLVAAARAGPFARPWDDGAGGQVEVWVRGLLPEDPGTC